MIYARCRVEIFARRRKGKQICSISSLRNLVRYRIIKPWGIIEFKHQPGMLKQDKTCTLAPLRLMSSQPQPPPANARNRSSSRIHRALALFLLYFCSSLPSFQNTPVIRLSPNEEVRDLRPKNSIAISVHGLSKGNPA